jgi:hypothetical protein
MSRLRRFFPAGAILGALLALSMVNEARAGYEIQAVVMDLTTSTSTTFTVLKGGAHDASTNANTITAGNGFNTSGTGVTLSPFGASFTAAPGSPTSLTVSGTATVVPNNSDSFKITLLATNQFTTPTGNQGFLTQSSSATWSLTTTPGMQNFQSWWTPGTVAPPPTGTTPGQQTIVITASPTGTSSGSSSTPGGPTALPGYTTPYTLFAQATILISGNDKPSNASDAAQGTATVTAVPEPASLVMLLTGMPVPLVVLGMLRRRKAMAKS